MRLETLFVVIFLFFGTTFMALIPPGWNTDEANHTYRIYQLTTGNLFSEQVVDTQAKVKAYGGDVPANLIKLYDETGANKPGGIGVITNKVEADNRYQNNSEIQALADDGKLTSMHFSGGALYSPISYVIYMPIFLIGKLLSLPFFWIIILCRLTALLLTAAAFYFAIKYIPIGKWALFAVGLVPGVVIQAQSVGADAPQMIVCVLFITYIVRLIYQPKKLKIYDYAILAVLGVALALIKMAYVPMLLLMFALPIVRKQYRNLASTALIAAVFLLAVIPGIIWLQLVSYVDINSNPQANFSEQKQFILNQPQTFMKTLYYTFFTNEQSTLSNIYGSFVLLPAIYTYLATAMLGISVLVRSTREKINTKAFSKNEIRIWRISLLSISVITAALIATTLYIYSSTLRQSSIIGIQSRYFLPLLPLILLAFYGNTVRNQYYAKMGIIIMSLIVLTGSVLAAYHRLYQVIPPII